MDSVKEVLERADYTPRGKSMADNVFNFFSALGDVAFAYAGHNVVLEIQATIPSTPEKPSKGLHLVLFPSRVSWVLYVWE